MTDVIDRLDVVEVPPLDPVASPAAKSACCTTRDEPVGAPGRGCLLDRGRGDPPRHGAGPCRRVAAPRDSGSALAGWFQIITAWLLLSRKHRSLLLPIAVANAAFIGAWVWSRTAGLPVGAHKGIKEPVGFVDLTCVAFEVGASPRVRASRAPVQQDHDIDQQARAALRARRDRRRVRAHHRGRGVTGCPQPRRAHA